MYKKLLGVVLLGLSLAACAEKPTITHVGSVQFKDGSDVDVMQVNSTKALSNFTAAIGAHCPKGTTPDNGKVCDWKPIPVTATPTIAGEFLPGAATIMGGVGAGAGAAAVAK